MATPMLTEAAIISVFFYLQNQWLQEMADEGEKKVDEPEDETVKEEAPEATSPEAPVNPEEETPKEETPKEETSEAPVNPEDETPKEAPDNTEGLTPVEEPLITKEDVPLLGLCPEKKEDCCANQENPDDTLTRKEDCCAKYRKVKGVVASCCKSNQPKSDEGPIIYMSPKGVLKMKAENCCQLNEQKEEEKEEPEEEEPAVYKILKGITQKADCCRRNVPEEICEENIPTEETQEEVKPPEEIQPEEPKTNEKPEESKPEEPAPAEETPAENVEELQPESDNKVTFSDEVKTDEDEK